MESLEILDPLDEVHLFALDYIYKPRINRALKLFEIQWNSHPLSTEGNMTPYQLWVEGFYQFANSTSQTIREVVDPDTLDVNSYGVDDDDGPMPDIQAINHVEIPQSSIVLGDEDMAALALLVEPLEEDNECGKNLFNNTCEILERILGE